MGAPAGAAGQGAHRRRRRSRYPRGAAPPRARRGHLGGTDGGGGAGRPRAAARRAPSGSRPALLRGDHGDRPEDRGGRDAARGHRLRLRVPQASPRGAAHRRVTLPRAFYRRPVAIVARALLGCVLVSRRGRTVTAGRIVETEAYLGPEDAASHAAFRPGAHALLYGDGGFAYVFPAYGMHVCLNAVARGPGEPGCVLLRALEPLSGLTAMARRRGVPFHSP